MTNQNNQTQTLEDRCPPIHTKRGTLMVRCLQTFTPTDRNNYYVVTCVIKTGDNEWSDVLNSSQCFLQEAYAFKCYTNRASADDVSKPDPLTMPLTFTPSVIYRDNCYDYTNVTFGTAPMLNIKHAEAQATSHADTTIKKIKNNYFSGSRATTGALLPILRRNVNVL